MRLLSKGLCSEIFHFSSLNCEWCVFVYCSIFLEKINTGWAPDTEPGADETDRKCQSVIEIKPIQNEYNYVQKVFKPITSVRRERDELLELKWWRKGKSRINWVFKNECIWMEKVSQGPHVFFSKSCKVINFQRRPVWLKWQNDNSRKLDFKVAAFLWHHGTLFLCQKTL